MVLTPSDPGLHVLGRRSMRRPLVATVATVAVMIAAACSGDDATAPGTLPPTESTSFETVPQALPEPEWPQETGAGVTLAVLDRGVDWRHPDLRNPDGTTRIETIIDLSGQRAGCAPDRPDPVVILRGDIDAALAAGTDIGHRDAVGHGTATAGIAAGNGSASDGRFRGVAPGVDLVIVKISSEGLPPAGDDPGEESVAGCLDDALDVVDLVADALDQPLVALWNTGTQFGPIDGTSTNSRRIAESFGPDRPGRVWVAPAGDEGASSGRAGGALTTESRFEVPFVRNATTRSNPTLWYSGAVSAQVTVDFDDGVVIGPVGPGESVTSDGVTIVHYEPGSEFHPWTSTSGDRAVWISIERAAGAGVIGVEAISDDSSTIAWVDVFGDVLGGPGATSIEFTDHLAAGTVSDNASTPGAVVATAHLARTSWVDRTGRRIDGSSSAALGERWPGASVDPTRDGRAVISVSAPAHHVFAPLAEASAWSRRDDIVPAEGGGAYVVFAGTGAAAAMVAGAVALVLEVDPELTGTEVADLIRRTAVADNSTGDATGDATDEIPTPEWGHGKLDLTALVMAAREQR